MHVYACGNCPHCCAILQPTAHYITTFLKKDTPQCVCVCVVCVELDKADVLHNSQSALFITCKVGEKTSTSYEMEQPT